MKQRFLAAAKTTPSSSSSTGPTSRTLTSVAEEKDREAMKVAFEEGGEVLVGSKENFFHGHDGREVQDDCGDGAGTGPCSSFDGAIQGMVEPHAEEIRNPWNQFQQRHRGKGWSMDKMRSEY